jgi:tRNA pseudouridine38-40 synthase
MLLGSQRQPHGLTVENKLLEALQGVGWGPSSERSAIRLVSRTDKGVSATENIAFVEGDAEFLRHHNRIGRVQAQLDGIWVTGVADAGYAPPYHKEYWYYLPPSIQPDARLESACALFSGMHDFSSFAKTNALKDPVRTINVEARIAGQSTMLAFSGTGFLWQMCRRIAAACIALCQDDMTIAQVRNMLESPTNRKMPPAPAEHLVLRSVSSPILFSDVLMGMQAMKEYYSKRYAYWAPLVAQYASNL